MALDVQDGYTLAMLQNLGGSPQDEQDAYMVIHALASLVLADPAEYEQVGRVLIDAYLDIVDVGEEK